MNFKQLPWIPVGPEFIAATADLSALAGCSEIQVKKLKFIIGGGRDKSALRFARMDGWMDGDLCL